MKERQFKYLVLLLGILIRATLWKKDPSGNLESTLVKIEDEIFKIPFWIRKE